MVSASAISPVLAYYTPTKGFLLALVLAFAFNIYAGMKADGGEFHVLRELFFRQVQERPGRTGPLRGDNLLPLYGYDCNVIQALQNCCCQTQRQIADFRGDLFLQNCKDTAELRNGQRDLGFAITQGFSSTAFQAQQDKCDILRAGQDNTQRIIDTLNNHWKDEQALKIQDLKFELSQERQNSLINERFNRLINQLGMTQGLIKIVCGKSNCYAINSSLSVSIPAEPAA